MGAGSIEGRPPAEEVSDVRTLSISPGEVLPMTRDEEVIEITDLTFRILKKLRDRVTDFLIADWDCVFRNITFKCSSGHRHSYVVIIAKAEFEPLLKEALEEKLGPGELHNEPEVN
jgi:hypothetical protein